MIRHQQTAVVLHVIDQLSDAGGAEASLNLMLPGLEQHGIHNIVQPLSSRESTRHHADLVAAGVDIRQPYDTSVARSIVALRRTCRLYKPDIVHSVLWRSDLVARLADVGAAKRLTSLVNMQYSSAAIGAANAPAKLALYRRIDGWLARHRTDHFHALTSAARDAAIGAYGIEPKDVTVIPRGRPLALYDSSRSMRLRAREELGIRDDDEVILTVGRQVEQKNQVDAVRAFATVSRAHPRAMMLLVGPEGAASPGIRAEIASLPQPDRVILLGSRPDIPSLLSAADLFVFTSLWEGFGGAAVEAMAAGLPVVAYRIPPLIEVCGECAAWVEPRDVSALAQALTNALDDKAHASVLGRAGAGRAAERYGLDSVVLRMANLYKAIANESRPVADTVKQAG